MLAAIALCLAMLAQLAPGQAEAPLGLVVEKDTGRPLAGVSIRGADDPNSPTVTSDEQGRFDRGAIMRMNIGAGRGQGPPCWVRAEDDRKSPWEFVAAEAPAGIPVFEFHRRQAVGMLYRPCPSRWQGGTLIVECPPIIEIEAVVRSPEGFPLKDSPILIIPPSNGPFPGPGVLRLPRRTDREGVVRLRTFDGFQRFSLQAPGVGFGSTGVVHPTEGRIARLGIPPLARFARIEGRVDPKLFTTGMKVALLGTLTQNPSGPTSLCDDQGRFTLVDVIPGAYRLTSMKDGLNFASSAHGIQAEPGATLRDVVLEAPAPLSPEARRANQQLTRRLNGDRNKIVGWVEGTIRDEHGLPLPKAVVYVQVQYHGGIRMNEEVRKTTTDEQGRYKFEGPLQPSMGNLVVIASAKGRPPIVAYAPGPDAWLEDDERKSAKLDVALPAAGSSLSVTVLNGGKKLGDASVQITAADTIELRNRSFGPAAAQNPERDEMEALISRTVRTDPDGVARFDNLPSGPFEVIAIPNVDPAQAVARSRPFNLRLGVEGARTVTIPPAAAVAASINVGRQPKPFRFRLLKPDGTAVSGRNVSLGYGQGNAATSTLVRCDDRGVATYQFGSPGLWMVDIRFRDDARQYPILDEPYEQAQALIPISSELELEDPIVLRSERREPGSILAHLLDSEGKPAPGTVLILDSYGQPLQAGTVDAEGSVRFLDISSGKYRLQGVVDGRPPAPRMRAGESLPADDALRGVSTVFDREVTVTAGVETTAELRLQPAGYVGVVITPPDGRSAFDYYAYLDSRLLDDPARRTQVDAAGVAYLFGPFPPGPVTVGLFERSAGGPAAKHGERSVVVEAGKAVHIEFKP